MSQPNPFETGPPPVPVAVANTGPPGGPPSPPQTSYETNFDANGGYEANTYGADAYGDSSYGAPANQTVVAPPAPPHANNNVNAFDSNSGYDDSGAYGMPSQQSTDNKAVAQNNNNNMQTFDVASGEHPQEQKTWGLTEYTAYCPTKYMNAMCGACFIAGAVADLVLKFTFLDLFVDTWLVIVGLTHIFVEFPRSFWNARIQDPVFKWARFMERLWGRAMMLFMFSILMMSDTENPLKIVLGVPAFLATFLNLIISFTAASKLKRIYEFVGQGLEDEAKWIEIERKFDELDMLKLQKLRPEEIYMLAKQAGRDLNVSELETIVRYFDEKFCLEVHKDDWMRGFRLIDERGLRFL